MCLRLPKRGGNALAQATSEEEKKNAEIDRIIRRDKKQQSKNVKILLLGRSSPSETLHALDLHFNTQADVPNSRSWRVGQVHYSEADAPDSHGWISHA